MAPKGKTRERVVDKRRTGDERPEKNGGVKVYIQCHELYRLATRGRARFQLNWPLVPDLQTIDPMSNPTRLLQTDTGTLPAGRVNLRTTRRMPNHLPSQR